jgi:hypothetical protein
MKARHGFAPNVSPLLAQLWNPSCVFCGYTWWGAQVSNRTIDPNPRITSTKALDITRI